ncbi:isomerase [Kitasatospora sp. MAP5-34]|uniref:5-carboxymethyl-2-hydroxymuconate Delta-isomerase n=1 Tax=Kitasatospora sp. MAP5-34 TaxID=3035102 RepID=UPI002475BC11|nr:isomerase [Kitasatospora sp. MAP5-34]MDH6575880.1 5-carboxymethyl-2-hydroxymuconate isomerase [Kitasatospora sp. MAP5-34]
MPQITVDRSPTLRLDRRPFAAELHPLIASVIDSPVADCKTRFRRIEESFIGDGAPERAMVLLEIRLLSGRSPELKTELAERVLTLLQKHVVPEPGDELHLAVEVVDIDRAAYRKSVSA